MTISVLLYNNLSLPILEQYCKESKILLIESYAAYAGHHKKKLAFFISAMRHFYEEHKDRFDMKYIKTDKSPVEVVSELKAEEIQIFEPADYELWLAFSKLERVKIFEDPSFICSKKEFARLKPKIMEAFYRKMRLKTGLLLVKQSSEEVSGMQSAYSKEGEEGARKENSYLEGQSTYLEEGGLKESAYLWEQPAHLEEEQKEGAYSWGQSTLLKKTGRKGDAELAPVESFEPVGGKWNFDASNRKKMPDTVVPPEYPRFVKDKITLESIELVNEKFSNNFGEIEPFYCATTRSEALQLLEHFVEKALPNFGIYQDAMKVGENFLFHSILAPYLNIGLLSPLEVCRAAEQAFWKSQEGATTQVPIESVEGFIRQVIGWREYIRGVYWLQMPQYKKLNHLKAEQKLPDFYWSADTKLNCLRECISQTKQMAYSHHIQRLMVTGNFAMLIGAHPSAVHEWYLKVYADAHEWVELPNTVGMAIYADGGIVGTKPYACSANYINKMSDFCKNCRYNNKKRTGPNACPFNYLYWNFLIQHDFAKNPRMFAAYASLSKLSEEEKAQIKKEVKNFLATIFSRV